MCRVADNTKLAHSPFLDRLSPDLCLLFFGGVRFGLVTLHLYTSLAVSVSTVIGKVGGDVPTRTGPSLLYRCNNTPSRTSVPIVS